MRGLKYARDVVRATLRYRLQKMGLGRQTSVAGAVHASEDAGEGAVRGSSNGSRLGPRPAFSTSDRPTRGSPNDFDSVGTR